MLQKLFGFIVLISLVLFSGLTSHGASEALKLQFAGTTYTIEEAASPDSNHPFTVSSEDDTVLLSDKNSGIRAQIGLIQMDQDTEKSLRSYYNDNVSDTDVLFNKLVDLQESYIDAVNASLKENYLYGDGGKYGQETNLKLFSTTTETLFGQNSDIYTYNILTTSNAVISEERCIDIFVPFRSCYSLLKVHFSLQSGKLDENAKKMITQMLSAIYVNGYTGPSADLQILTDQTLVKAINEGIYPNPIYTEPAAKTLYVPSLGFKLAYPAYLNQYQQNNIIQDYYYNSFKISSGEVFSISVEPTASSSTNGNPVLNKASQIKKGLGTSLKVISEGLTSVSGQQALFISYEYYEDAIRIYTQELISASKGHIYRLKLDSCGNLPSVSALQAFSSIFSSFELLPLQEETAMSEPSSKSSGSNTAYSLYLNKNTGMSFQMPEEWTLSDIEPTSDLPKAASAQKLSSQEMLLTLPEISDFLSIRLTQNTEISPPYAGSPFTVLMDSKRMEGSISYTYKLVNYLDQEDQGRLCALVEAVRSGRKYAMAVTVHSGWQNEGKVYDQQISAIVNIIFDSFKVENPLEEAAAGKGTVPPPKNRKGYGNSATPLFQRLLCGDLPIRS